MLFWTYLALYSFGRFFVQFFRVDTPFALGLSQAQLLSVLTGMVAVWFLVYLSNRARKLGPSPAPVPIATTDQSAAAEKAPTAAH